MGLVRAGRIGGGACVVLRAGFTLIELLVVVAVVGVLLAILVPALGGARGAAQMVQGASNVRQLQVANLAYADDHDGRFMPGAVGFQRTNLHRWHGTRETREEPFVPEGAPIGGYLEGRAGSEDGGVRMCPRFRPRLEALIEAGEGFERGNGGYGYNNAFVGTRRSRRWVGGEAVWDVASDASGSRVSRFDGPARTVAFADAAFAGDGGLIEYSFAEPAYWPGYAGDYRPDPSIHFRQVGGEANVAWLDGRVSQEERTATHWSGIYAVDPGSVGLGWFGDASGNALFDYE